ncbi:MAG: hypothetical protein ACUVTR_02160 [Dehalococcoidia bacterium]
MEVCYICSSNRYVDDHHVDCQYGEVSPDTVPLCRRCHRTFHDWGVEWFDDELVDRAIGVENMRRTIFGEPPLERKDIVRSDYWYKKHGIKRPDSDKRIIALANAVTFKSLVRPGIEPLCGWPWVEENMDKVYSRARRKPLFSERGNLCHVSGYRG